MKYATTIPKGECRWLIEQMGERYTLRAGSYDGNQYNYGPVYLGRNTFGGQMFGRHVVIDIMLTATPGAYHVNRRLDVYGGTHEICDGSIFTDFGFAEPTRKAP